MKYDELSKTMRHVEETWASNCKLMEYSPEEELRYQQEYFLGAKAALRYVFSEGDAVLLRKWDYCLAHDVLLRESKSSLIEKPFNHTAGELP
jgi:hypothetical protein